MKKTLIGLLLILGIIAVGCNQPTVEEANEAFCQSLQAFGDALTNLETISPTSTVGDLKDASAEVDKAWNQVTNSAKQLNEVKLDTIDESWKNLRRTVNQVNDNDTLLALHRVDLDGDREVGEERYLIGERVRDVRVGPDGAIYVTTEEHSGEPIGTVLRLTPQ